MRILTYCDTHGGDIAQRLGMPDYSYHFVRESIAAALQGFAHVQPVDDPGTQVDAIWQECHSRGEPCLLLSFAPPHRTPLGLRCPTFPVFAWEYPNLPVGDHEPSWSDDPRHDWRRVLVQTAGAITLSQHTAQAVRNELGDDYPVLAVPTPVWDMFSRPSRHRLHPPNRSGVEICMEAVVVDSDMLGLSAENILSDHPDDGTPSDPQTDGLLVDLPPSTADRWDPSTELPEHAPPETIVSDNLPEGSAPAGCGWTLPSATHVRTRLQGVVYTAVITPSDGRKNWEDLITAFAWAFRDVEDATLVLKLGGPRQLEHHCQMLMLLSKLSPIKCRVIAIHGYLDDPDYRQLIDATTYYVNASLCEGLCMPLLEFLSAGVPAIAPNHTAMADYIDSEFAFVVDSHADMPALWPHGDWNVYRTRRYQVDWYSLMQSYRNSYLRARGDAVAYEDMSRHAAAAMRVYCSIDSVRSELQPFLQAQVAEATRRNLQGMEAAP